MAKSIKMGKAYDNVFDMLRETYPDHPEYADNAFQAYRREQISSTLFMLRMRLDVSREELSRRSGLSLNKIAKMEDDGDSVKFNDMITYVTALDHEVKLMIEEKTNNLAGTLRWHFQAIAAIMTKFVDLAKDDPDISSGVFEHFKDEAGKMLNEVFPKCEAMLAKAKLRDASDIPQTNFKTSDGGLNFEYHAKDGAVLV